jgi:hypothetical protein
MLRAAGRGNNSIFALQRAIGNQAVLRRLQAQDESSHDRSPHDFPISSRPSGAIQTKLTVNRPGDSYEQEADRVAEQVMRMPEASANNAGAAAAPASSAAPGIQRACACGGSCDDCKKKRPEDRNAHVQMKAAGPGSSGGMEAPPIVHEALRSPGQPLDRETRAFMEPRFGHDFRGVRVHTDAKAQESASAVNAKAYTVGSDVVLAAGQPAAGSHEGTQLLAHELTHVVQQSGAGPSVQRQIHHRAEEDEPGVGFTCGLLEMSRDDFDERSCCADNIMQQLRRMLGQAREALTTAVQRIDSGASVDSLLRQHFGPSGPSQRSTIAANIRSTLAVANTFLEHHTFRCRPLSDRWGCTGSENARAGTDTDITVCMGGGAITFDWTTILHELFHMSGVADLPVLGETTTHAQEAAGEFETYYSPTGAESTDARWRRYPSSAPLRNADSYRQFVAAISAPDFTGEAVPARFVPTLAVGAGFMAPGLQPAIVARLAFTPAGRGLHFITPGAVGVWMPTLGAVRSTDPDATQPHGYAGGELGARLVTGSGPVAGVFDLAAGAGAVWTRGGSVDPGAMVRASAGVRFGGPEFGASLNADMARIFDFALREQRTDGWILGFSAGLHWGGHSGAPR